MAGDNQHARRPYGRAGIDPRRKPMSVSFATACADSPAQSPPYGVDVRTCFLGLFVTHHLPLATAFLIATVANSEIGPRHSKRWTSPFSNRNKNTLSGFQIFSMTLYPEPAAAATACPTGLLAGNVLAGEAVLRARFQPPASCSQPPARRSIMGLRRGVQTPESNRNKVRIEFAATYSKQRIGTNSNRNNFRGPCISFFSAIRRHREARAALAEIQGVRASVHPERREGLRHKRLSLPFSFGGILAESLEVCPGRSQDGRSRGRSQRANCPRGGVAQRTRGGRHVACSRRGDVAGAQLGTASGNHPARRGVIFMLAFILPRKEIGS
jgi:hypothetical protein